MKIESLTIVGFPFVLSPVEAFLEFSTDPAVSARNGNVIGDDHVLVVFPEDTYFGSHSGLGDHYVGFCFESDALEAAYKGVPYLRIRFNALGKLGICGLLSICRTRC